ncbi:alpha/beta hydrolase fold [Parafrankia sp. EAN1pec]|uniref:alpha/beta fold hydrolase n=1 Tax=Parafrankia sp. (strain EAN1pec) TaxID=298653 RepID=UPI0000544E88|nr:alpha/beta hydrolase fold [Frankia sp. EAN1pec]
MTLMETLTHFVRRGTGEPTVLLHGVGSRAQVWDPLVVDLARQREVVAVDLPGFGHSPRGDVRATVAGYADHVSEVCGQLGLRRPHVAGHSLGGAVALELGRRGEARSVVAFSPVGFWGPSGQVWCQGVLSLMRVVGPKVRPVLPALLATGPGKAALFGMFYGAPHRVPAPTLVADADSFATCQALPDAVSGFADHVFTERGALDDIPVTVAWGGRDLVLPRLTQGRRARRALPRARHVTLPGAGHVPFYDDPVSCLMLLLHQWGEAGPLASSPSASPGVGTDTCVSRSVS